MLMVLAMLAAAAPAAETALPLGPITDPQWDDVRAAPGELQRLFPPAALAQGQSGVAAVECTVTEKGALSACKTLKEVPEGFQFGEAAVKVVARFHMKSTSRSGTSVAGRVIRIPVEFDFAWTAYEPLDTRPSFKISASPKWVRKLDQEAFAKLYPAAAQRGDIEGQALLRCHVQLDGTLAECSLSSEAPSGYGFGEAAMKAVLKLQLNIHEGAGLTAAGRWVDIPIHFRLPPD